MLEKIKICVIANIDKTIKFLLLPQLKFLLDKGYEIYVVCSPGSWIEELKKEGLKVKTIRIKRRISPFFDLIVFFQLLIFLKKEKFQIVHTHTPKASLLGQLSAKLVGVPIIINTIHGFYFTENTFTFKKKFFIFLEKLIGYYSDLVFFQSKEDVETAKKEKIIKESKIKHLGNGIDIEKFDPQKFSAEFILNKKRELGIDCERKIIGIVARLVKEKGYLELFQALKKVLEKFPQVLLLVIGPVDLEKKDSIDPDIVKKYNIEENVIFLGERLDVDELYAIMDIFVLPSWREGMPRSLLEALAMEKPCVATNIRGCREIIDSGKNGILVPIKDSQNLAQAIIYLLENPQIAKELGQIGRERILKEFDERVVFNKIKKEYEKLIFEKLRAWKKN